MSEMDRKDHADIVEHLKAKLADHGLQDIARDEHYVKTGPDDIYRLMAPQAHTIALLEAFRRHVKINSRETYDKAMMNIREHTRGEVPEDFHVTGFMTFEDTVDTPLSDERTIKLSNAPYRKKLIEHIDSLIISLAANSEGEIHE